ncbi:MAG: hypothetical protein FWG50_03225, partial [Kiritimatiellaeota bacterium]|nr:hypothetical protein [Kiritimatiellota bacterium]
EAAVDGLPAAAAFESYSPIRIPGAATTVRGDGFIVNNAGGLLTQHVHMKDGLGGNVAGGLTATLYVYADGEGEPVEVGFRSPGGAFTNALPVSKWENAFWSLGSNVVFKTPRFTDTDPDRFRFYVKDRRRTEPVIHCNLWNLPKGEEDYPSAIYLYRQPDGTYLSTNFIITADATDRNVDALLEAGGASSYPMLVNALGDERQIEYSYDGIATSAIATVGMDFKTLTVDVAVMQDFPGQGACVGKDRIEKDIKAMQARYAQANIKVVWGNENDYPVFEPPQSVVTNMTNWVAYTRFPTGFVMTAESRDIMDAADLGTENVRVIYVRGDVRERVFQDGAFVIRPGIGVAFPKYPYPDEPDQYVDACFVSAGAGAQTAAHEGEHILEGGDPGDKPRGHSTSPWNLMYPYELPVDDLRGTRRLTQEQVNQMRTNGIKRGRLK